MVLIAFIDDATSRVMKARFIKAESTEASTRILMEYFQKYGLPQALYSNRLSMFRQTKDYIHQRRHFKVAARADISILH